jgi:hypothetical protein
MADYDLRALRKLLAPARALKKDLEELSTQSTDHAIAGFPNAIAAGIGEMAIQNLGGLIDRAAALTEDDYISSLKPVIPDEAGDIEKIMFAKLALTQVVAYIEGEMGTPAQEETVREPGGNKVSIGGNLNLSDGKAKLGLDELGDMLSKIVGGGELGEQIREKIKESLDKPK